MKRSAVVLAGALLSTAFFLGKPSIQFDRLEHDFGEVPENSEQSCRFSFHNAGSATLIIERVGSG